MSIEVVLFFIFSGMALGSALLVVGFRDPVKGALSLVTCFFAIACLYLIQSAELIAVLEVLVYAGAIMVLFVFVIMLVENNDEPIVAPGLLKRIMVPVKIAAVALVSANFLVIIAGAKFGDGKVLPAGFGSPKSVGMEFFQRFLFHFELTSVLLLAAVVGAVIISRRVSVGGKQ